MVRNIRAPKRDALVRQAVRIKEEIEQVCLIFLCQNVNVITKAYTDDNLQLELPSKTISIKNDFQSMSVFNSGVILGSEL